MAVTTLNPVADAWVDESNPSANTGLDTTLYTDGGPSGNVRLAFLKFDLSALSGTLTSAVLRVYQETNSGQDVDAYAVADTSWSETGITWANQPATGALLATAPGPSSGLYIELDVTAGITLGQLNSLRFSKAGSTNVRWTSKDAGANMPELVVTYTPGGGGAINGAAAAILPALTSSSAASMTPPAFSAAAAATLPSLTASATGTIGAALSIAGITGWELVLDADDPTTIDVDGSNNVVAWRDKAGGGIALSTFSGVTSNTRTLQGRNVVDVPAAGYLQWPTAHLVPQPFTIFVVVDNDEAATVNRYITDGDGSVARFILGFNASLISMYAGTAWIHGTSAPAIQEYLLSAIGNGASSILRVNGTQEGAGNPGTQDFDLITLGSASWDGAIAELLVYPGELTAQQILDVEAYLNAKWFPGSAITATASATLPGLTSSAAASMTPPTITATTSATLPGLSASSTARITYDYLIETPSPGTYTVRDYSGALLNTYVDTGTTSGFREALATYGLDDTILKLAPGHFSFIVDINGVEDHMAFNTIVNLLIIGSGIDVTFVENYSEAAQDTEPFSYTRCNGAAVMNLTVDADGTARSSSDALDFDDVSGGLVDTVKVTKSRARGIIFDGKDPGAAADNNIIRDSYVTGTPGTSIGHGIEILGGQGNQIYRNTVEDPEGGGIYIVKGTGPTGRKANANVIYGNVVRRAGRDGIIIVSSDDCEVFDNIVEDASYLVASTDGISVETADGVNADRNKIHNNIATDSRAAGSKTQRYGVNVAPGVATEANDNEIVNNTLYGNRVAPYADSGTNTVISGNLTTQPSFAASAAATLPGLNASAQGTTAGIHATAAASLPALTSNAAATTTVPAFNGSTTATLPSLTVTVAAVMTPPAYQAVAAATLPGLASSSAATVTAPALSASAAATLPSLAVNATVTTTVPAFTAAAAATLPALSLTASGTRAVAFSASVTASLPALTTSSAATATVPVFAATAAATLPGFTVSAAATTAVPAFTAGAAATLPLLVGSASATTTVSLFSATAAGTLPSLAASTTATTTVPSYLGTVTATLPAPQVSAAGSVAQGLRGSLNAALPALTASAAAVTTIPTRQGAVSASLQPLAANAAATTTVPGFQGAVSATLPALQASVSATQQQAFAGAVTAPLPALSGSSTATSTVPGFQATATATLPGLAASAAATTTVPGFQGGVAASLPALQASATGSFAAGNRTATLTATLSALSAAAAATTTVPGFQATATATLPGLQLTATGIKGQIVDLVHVRLRELPDRTYILPLPPRRITVPLPERSYRLIPGRKK